MTSIVLTLRVRIHLAERDDYTIEYSIHCRLGLSPAIGKSTPISRATKHDHFRKVTPILRIFDEAKAKEFYVDFLGFKIDWEHRFADDLPLYMQVSKDDCILHLSGHFGDCCPGSAVRIETTGLEEYHQELLAKRYKHARPGIEHQPWGEWAMSIKDPFGNRLDFYQPADAGNTT